jgi:adenylate cyclase
MICGGLKDADMNFPPEVLQKNHGERTVSVAIEIINKLENVYLKTGEKLQVKIGINSGPVIAGVVGDHKP